MKNVNIEELILDYVQNNITEEIKEEFINAAVHFIINQDNCSHKQAHSPLAPSQRRPGTGKLR